MFLRWHVLGVYLSLFISSACFSLIAMVQIFPWLSIKLVHKKRLGEMLRFSLPMIPATMAYWVINSTDAYFLQYFKDKSEVGLFYVGSSLAAGLGLITGAFQQAWGPFALSIMKDPDAKETYANVFLVVGFIGGGVILCMFLFSDTILFILTTPQYFSASWVASILSINMVLISLTYIANIGATIVKNSLHYSVAIFIACIANVVFSLLIIPPYGKEGSAIATVLAQSIVPVYVFYKSQKLFPIDYRFGTVILMLIIAIVIGVLVRNLEMSSLLIGSGIRIAVLCLFVSFSFFFLRKTLASVLYRLN